MMKILSSFALVMGLMLSSVSTYAAEVATKTFVVITSESVETQGMALILSLQALKNGSDVRILLCDHGGDIAKKRLSGDAVEALERDTTAIVEKSNVKWGKSGCLCLISAES